MFSKGGLYQGLTANPAVKNVYGRMFAYDVPVIVNGEEKLLTLFPMKICNSIGLRIMSCLVSLERVQRETDTGLIVFEPAKRD